MAVKTKDRVALTLSWLIGAILVVLPFHALLTTWAGSNTGHLDFWRIWKEILIVGMVPPATWLAWQSAPIKRWFQTSLIVRLIGFYFLLHFAIVAGALANGEVNSKAAIYGLLVNLRFLGFFLVCIVVAASSDWLKKRWQLILFGPATVVIIFGLLQRYLLQPDFLRHFGYSPSTIPAYQTVDSSLDFRRIQSTLRGANPLGAYLVLIIAAFVGPGLRHRLWRTAGYTAGLAVLFLSYSRSAWLGLVLTLGVLAWWSLPKRNRVGKLALGVGAVILVLAVGLYFAQFNKIAQDTLFHTSSNSSAKQSSNAERTRALKNGLSDVIHQPLGRGSGTAGPASLRNNHPGRIAENYYLQIGQEVGVFGVALFVAINVFVARELWRLRRDLLAKILLASLAGISLINLLSHAWTDDTLSLLWWGLAGIALSPVILRVRHKQNGELLKKT